MSFHCSCLLPSPVTNTSIIRSSLIASIRLIFDFHARFLYFPRISLIGKSSNVLQQSHSLRFYVFLTQSMRSPQNSTVQQIDILKLKLKYKLSDFPLPSTSPSTFLFKLYSVKSLVWVLITVKNQLLEDLFCVRCQAFYTIAVYKITISNDIAKDSCRDVIRRRLWRRNCYRSSSPLLYVPIHCDLSSFFSSSAQLPSGDPRTLLSSTASSAFISVLCPVCFVFSTFLVILLCVNHC